MKSLKFVVACWLLFVGACNVASAALTNDAYCLSPSADGSIALRFNGETLRFAPKFSVLTTAQNPKMDMRRAEFPGDRVRPIYNVLTWEIGKTVAATKLVGGGHVEDGFDPISDQKLDGNRTADLFHSATVEAVTDGRAKIVDGHIVWTFPNQQGFTLAATVEVPAGIGEPVLTFHFTPRRAGWFSVGYTGAPEISPADMDEIWQPLIWQEKRFPKQSVLTESGRCTLPATFVNRAGVTWGVVADPAELSFMPMPTWSNSRFGVAVRNATGLAQPMVFAPILGGVGSKMEAGVTFTFKLRLFVSRQNIPDSYVSLAQGLFGFHDYRHNALGSLNRVLERTVDYAMSDWACFNADLRGCAYDTDVPGAVKNVSALHPLSLAMVTDDERIFDQRARPIMEYLMSREKFLFAANSKIKGQGASSRLNGPCAPVSELTALYAISGRRSPFLLDYAEDLFGKTRTLNLDDPVRGDVWQNALAIYRATGDSVWVEKAKAGADRYITQRLDSVQTNFSDPASRGMFFWTSFAPNWMELYDLYETTGEHRYLEAAHEGARRFAQFVWMVPTIPNGDVLVNNGGQAPLYRKSENLQPIKLPEESVPAWRVSEIGLTCESAATSKGHRAILLATHAPWMLRLAQASGDTFLHDIARSAVIGRYTSFPGYHMNTARTTVYEKPDFADRPLSQLDSTTSLHYNHIWPQAAMLLDYFFPTRSAVRTGRLPFRRNTPKVTPMCSRRFMAIVRVSFTATRMSGSGCQKDC
jgi:hypothetical protein